MERNTSNIIIVNIVKQYTCVMYIYQPYTVIPLLKDTPNKGHNRFNLSIKGIFCGP